MSGVIDWHKPNPAITALWQQSYRDASPFPHLVIDGLIDGQLLSKIAAASVSQTTGWTSHHTALQSKRTLDKPASLPKDITRYFRLVYSTDFIGFLEQLTGIRGLLPDPELFGGGLHEAGTHGRFEIHVDFQRHPISGRRNRLALITYLNEGWTDADGGALELWCLKDRKRHSSIVPVMGRTLIMEQSPEAAHGYPMAMGANRKRRALIAYFYTEAQPEDVALRSDNTLYLDRPGMPLKRRLLIIVRRLLPDRIVRHLRVVASFVAERRRRR